MEYDSLRFLRRLPSAAAALAFPAFFSPFLDAFGGMINLNCEFLVDEKAVCFGLVSNLSKVIVS